MSDDLIGDFLSENSARQAVTGWIVEAFITQAGDPSTWGPQPNMHLLRKIVADTGLDLEPWCIEDVVGYIWSVYIAPLRNELQTQWEEMAHLCPHCGEIMHHQYSLDAGGYREACSCPQTPYPGTPSGTSRATLCSA